MRPARADESPTAPSTAAAAAAARTTNAPSSPRPAWTAARAPQANGEKANTSRSTTKRSTPRAARPPPAMKKTGSRLSRKPRPRLRKRRRSWARRLRASARKTRPATWVAARVKAKARATPAAASGSSNGPETRAAARARRSGSLASTSGSARFARSDEARRVGRDTGKWRRRDRSWVSLKARPARSGESAQNTPTRVAAAERRGRTHSGCALARACTPRKVTAAARSEPRARVGTSRARPNMRSRAPKSARRSMRQRRPTSAIRRSTPASLGSRSDPRQVLAPDVRRDQLQEHVLQARVLADFPLGPDIVDRPLGHDPPPVDHRHLVAEPLHHVEHVGGEEEGHPLGGHAPQEVRHHPARHGVDPVERLVQEEHPRVVDEGRGQGQLLLHPLREVGDQLAPVVGQAEELEELDRAPSGLRPRQPVHPPRELQVLLAGEPLVERELLGQDPDHALHPQQVLAEPHPLDHRVARGGPQQAGQHLDRGALARSVRAQEAEEAAAGHPEREVIDRGLPAEDLGEALHHEGVAARRLRVLHARQVNRFRARDRVLDPATWKWTSADRLFLRLVQECHRRQIKVVLDATFNHVGLTFWAFRDVRSTRTSEVFTTTLPDP